MTRHLAALLMALAMWPGAAGADTKAEYLKLAKLGWDYAFRGTARGRAGALPPSHVMARRMPGRDICLLGEPPHPELRATLVAFRAMIAEIFGTLGDVARAGPEIGECDAAATLFLRFYSLEKPDAAFNDDLAALDARFGFGLSKRRLYAILSPAQAVTLFGRDEQITHIALMQPRHAELTRLERRFFRSLIIEELYQSYSFGIDVFHMDAARPALSKLQEVPVNLRFLSWVSGDYMQGLLASNPDGLCHFDAMMLHALAGTKGGGRGDLLAYLEANFRALDAAAHATAADARFATLFDPACAEPPP